MTDKTLNSDQQLDLIVDMINRSKGNYASGSSFYFLLWGWTVLLANLGHYIISSFELYEAPYIVWMITIPSGVASMIYGIRSGKNKQSSNHIDKMYGLIWGATAIACVSILFIVPDARLVVNPIILILAGLVTVLSGFLLRFKPLILGGIALFICALVSSQLAHEMHYLLGAIGIFLGYLIPGYLLKKVENA